MALESVQRFRPEARIVAHFDNVKSGVFDPDFFRRFDVVLNGLDNLDARRHVNRRCLAAEVPLVESGTAGYLGQARRAQRTERSRAGPSLRPRAGFRPHQRHLAVLRMRAQSCAQDLPRVHHPQHAREGAPWPLTRAQPNLTVSFFPLSQPIHCIVWAKDMLFATLFGPKGASELEEEDVPAGVTTEEEDATKETTEVRHCCAARIAERHE